MGSGRALPKLVTALFPPKSHLFHGFGKYVKTLKNSVKMALGIFEILFIFISQTPSGLDFIALVLPFALHLINET